MAWISAAARASPSAPARSPSEQRIRDSPTMRAACLDVMICCRATDYERLDISGTQLPFQVGADESAVHSFDDNGLAFDLVGFSNSNFTLS
jgi:hypothetical protein